VTLSSLAVESVIIVFDTADTLIRYIMLVRMLRVLRILADIERFSGAPHPDALTPKHAVPAAALRYGAALRHRPPARGAAVVFQIFLNLIPMFSSLVVVLFVIMYGYAQVGVALFGGRILRLEDEAGETLEARGEGRAGPPPCCRAPIVMRPYARASARGAAPLATPHPPGNAARRTAGEPEPGLGVRARRLLRHQLQRLRAGQAS
jgi:hypothetical protein